MHTLWRGSRRPPWEEGFCSLTTTRSEEHTSELQSRLHLVCRLLLEKKKHILNFALQAEQDSPPLAGDAPRTHLLPSRLRGLRLCCVVPPSDRQTRLACLCPASRLPRENLRRHLPLGIRHGEPQIKLAEHSRGRATLCGKSDRERGVACVSRRTA